MVQLVVNGETIDFKGLSEEQALGVIKGNPGMFGLDTNTTGPKVPGQVVQPRSTPGLMNQEVRGNPQFEGGLRVPAIGASGAVHALAQVAGTPGDLVELGVQRGMNPLLAGLGLPTVAPLDPNGFNLLPTSAQTTGLTSRLGLTNRSDLMPGTRVEKAAEVVGEGLGSAAPFLLVGAPPVSTLAAGVGGAAAAEGARVLGQGPLGQTAAGVLGGGTAQAGLGFVDRALINTVPRAAKRLGAESTTIQRSGEIIQDAANQWMKETLPNLEREAFAGLDAGIGGSTTVPLTETQATLRKILRLGGEKVDMDAAKMAGGGAADRLWKLLSGKGNAEDIKFTQPPRATPTTPPEGKIPGGLTSMNPPEAVGGPIPATGGLKPIINSQSYDVPFQTPLWDTTRNLRSWIGEGMDDSLLRGLGQKNLDRLYAAFTADLQKAAEGAGVGAEFKNANAESYRLRTLAEKHIEPVARANTPGAAYNRAFKLSEKEGTTLEALRGQIPDAVTELAAAHLLQTPKGWAALAPEAKIALVPDSGHRMRIDSAVANLLKPTDTLSTLKHMFAGTAIGASSGVIANELMRHLTGGAMLDPLVGGAAGELLGIAAPALLGAVGGAFRHPVTTLRGPGVGGIAGGNSFNRDIPSSP